MFKLPSLVSKRTGNVISSIDFVLDGIMKLIDNFVVPVHKKGRKQTLKNYRHVSLFPICREIFERSVYNSLFEFFIANKLISSNQSGFKPGNSCINQLLSISHEI